MILRLPPGTGLPFVRGARYSSWFAFCHPVCTRLFYVATLVADARLFFYAWFAVWLRVSRLTRFCTRLRSSVYVYIYVTVCVAFLVTHAVGVCVYAFCWFTLRARALRFDLIYTLQFPNVHAHVYVWFLVIRF